MDKLITLLTFYYPHEALVIRQKLEAEGVFVFLQDELTVQNFNFLSNAVGGVKLQVRESDLEKALAIVKESGYLQDKTEADPGPLEEWVDKRVKDLYLIKEWPIAVKIVFIAGLIFIILSGFI